MNMKKLISMVLALVMLLAMSATAFADKDTAHTITITNKETDHTYEAYQIFVGTLAEDGSLIDLSWGSGVNSENLLTALKGNETIGSKFNKAETVTDVAEVVASFNDSEIAVFAEIVDKNLAAVSGTSNETKGEDQSTYVINVTGDGYYLVKDKKDSVTKPGNSYTKLILQVVDNVNVKAKSSSPKVEKKVEDKNDTTGKTSGWQDSADHDIGDDVNFQITATLGDGLTDYYTTYKLIFHDTLDSGFKFNDDVSITINGGDPIAESAFDVQENNGKITITIADVIALGAKDGNKVVVTYSAELTENANIGSVGNVNKVYLEYSNNPNSEGTGTTTEDKVIVFTYKVIVNKVDENNQPLEGAEFTLSKKQADGSWKEIAKVTGTAGTTFEWVGLDDGIYKIKETSTPDGYNSIEDIEFEITAEHDEESDNPTLTKLEGGVLVTGEFKDTGVIIAAIENRKGAELPSTGAQGTKMIYIAGGILVAAAAVLLIVKRRMGDAE